jgi:hypothetical protein
MNKKRLFPALFVMALALNACEGAKEQLGLEKKAPDEFAVVKRAPLAMPPDYDLRPPQPGAPRPQEQATSAQARQAIFGSESVPQAVQVPVGDAEGSILQQAGAAYADPTIRQKLNQEASELVDYNKPVARRLFGIGGDADEPSATVVDAPEEAERLKKNMEEGKPVTEGETPSIEK